MLERGSGRRRGIVIAAVVLALALVVPDLAAPAGAVTARSSSRTEMHAQSGAHAEFAAKRKKKKRKKLTAAQKKARLAKYLKAHPAVLAAHLKTTNGTTPKATTPKPKATKKKKKKAGKGFLPKKKKTKKKAKKPAKKKKKAAATTKKKAGGHPLGLTGWLELLVLALLPFGAVLAFLVGTDYQRRPRAPSPTRRRRTLVITPMNRNR